MYQEVILDHYKNPTHAGLKAPFDAEVHYEATGCSISQASVSVMAEEIVGKPLPEALDKLAEFEKMITSRGHYAGDDEIIGDGIAFSGVSQYPARVKCALLGWKAFQAAAAESMEEQE